MDRDAFRGSNLAKTWSRCSGCHEAIKTGQAQKILNGKDYHANCFFTAKESPVNPVEKESSENPVSKETSEHPESKESSANPVEKEETKIKTNPLN